MATPSGLQDRTHTAEELLDDRALDGAPTWRRFYLRVRTRFLISVCLGLAWAGFSTWIAINVLIASVMLYRLRHVFRELGLKIRRNYFGFLAYLLLYSPIMSRVSFVGYVKELRRAERHWK